MKMMPLWAFPSGTLADSNKVKKKKKKKNPDKVSTAPDAADPLSRLIFLSSLCYKTLSLQEELKTASGKVEIEDKKKTTHQELTGIHARLNVTFRQRWQYL